MKETLARKCPIVGERKYFLLGGKPLKSKVVRNSIRWKWFQEAVLGIYEKNKRQ